MKKCPLYLLATVMLLFVQSVLSQAVKIGSVALGMSESEVKAALASSAFRYSMQASASSDLYYLVARSAAESFAFTFIDGRVAAFSLVHILPPGQQPFLPPGQEPTVATLRTLVIKQTWKPAEINKGDTLWLRDTAGLPIADAAQCTPASGAPWLPFEPLPGSKPGEPPERSTVGLMKPAVASYPADCGVSIHLQQEPAASESDRVTTVRIQALDIAEVREFIARHPQH